MTDLVDGYLIRETEKARLIEISDTSQQIWVPKSVTDYIMTGPTPDKLAGKLPGPPILIRVAPWFRSKNAGPFGD